MASPESVHLTRIADSLVILEALVPEAVKTAEQFERIADLMEERFELIQKAVQVLGTCIHQGPTKAAGIHIYMTERT